MSTKSILVSPLQGVFYMKILQNIFELFYYPTYKIFLKNDRKDNQNRIIFCLLVVGIETEPCKTEKRGNTK